ncbi:hypothetical protein [Sodalis-like endosymbiont of Proechinophthirus fluctus]|uniref:hypothetical protein n=1 Tax=Sodalis-like endosymbiont of Proechinophthirus fluctus TaxID=1462730 RepID=UPI000ACF3423|nr:hypothetical protein [Sodalis-like endosymbiont of Proechinophthirus fluctus]
MVLLDGLEIEFGGKALEIPRAGRFLSTLGDVPWTVVNSASPPRAGKPGTE